MSCPRTQHKNPGHSRNLDFSVHNNTPLGHSLPRVTTVFHVLAHARKYCLLIQHSFLLTFSHCSCDFLLQCPIQVIQHGVVNSTSVIVNTHYNFILTIKSASQELCRFVVRHVLFIINFKQVPVLTNLRRSTPNHLETNQSKNSASTREYSESAITPAKRHVA